MESQNQPSDKSDTNVPVDAPHRPAVLLSYDALFNGMLDGFSYHEVIVDENNEPVDYRFLAVNPAFEKMTGLAARDLIGRRVLEVIPETEPHWIKTFGEVALSGKPILFEQYSRAFDKYFEVLAFQPHPRHFACTFHDITRRKRAEDAHRESETKTRAILDYSFGFIGLLDPHGNLLDANRTSLEFAGARLDEVLGRPLWEAPWWSHSSELQERLQRAIRTAASGEFVRFEATHSSRDGGQMLVDFTLKPVLDESGKVIYLIPEGRDITDLKKMEEELRQVNKMEAIGRLAGGIAHDFNNQLNGIMVCNDLIGQSLTDPELIKFSAMITQAVEQSANLIKQLLSFSRKAPYIESAVNVNQLMLDTLDVFEHSIDKKISVLKNIQAPDAIVDGDSAMLQNAILNLVINARDAMPNGGVLKVETKNIDGRELKSIVDKKNSDEVYLVICIHDTGHGMDVSVIKNIFEPFFTTKQLQQGTGLGLASVYGTIKRHGGWIDVESQVGTGSVFNIYLPVSKKNSGAIDFATNSKKINTLLKDAHILVVDDEINIATVISTLFTKIGCKTTTLQNGALALDYFTNYWREIDLVILDMNMPVMNGAETLEAMRAINPEAKVLILSGFGESQVGGLIEKGAVGYLSKPIRAKQLIDDVEKALLPQRKPNAS